MNLANSRAHVKVLLRENAAQNKADPENPRCSFRGKISVEAIESIARLVVRCQLVLNGAAVRTERRIILESRTNEAGSHI